MKALDIVSDYPGQDIRKPSTVQGFWHVNTSPVDEYNPPMDNRLKEGGTDEEILVIYGVDKEIIVDHIFCEGIGIEDSEIIQVSGKSAVQVRK